jgi:MoaA/NifB/PqqE/SkfB family radical SAM enzyme
MLKRVVLNFNSKCILKCPWCYVPFGAPPPSETTVMAIVDRLSEMQVKAITFGGGDPFQYQFMPSILKHAKTLGMFVHVDTHAKALFRSRRNLDLLTEYVDLLGLPLDGATPAVHDLVRSLPGHFEIINKCIQWLGPLRQRLKLNTIVTSINVGDVNNLAKLVVDISPYRWSLYQFWPLGPARAKAVVHQVNDETFAQVAASIDRILNESTIVYEATPRVARFNSYPIIHHDGSVMAHHSDLGNIVHLGSLFDVDIEEKIKCGFAGERQSAISRYQSCD